LQECKDYGWKINAIEADTVSWPTHTLYYSIDDGPFEGVYLMDNKNITTTDTNGENNGSVLEIQSDLHGFMIPGVSPQIDAGIQQVYMTMCRPGMKKGLHWHKIKEDNFTCIAGNAIVCLENKGRFLYIPMGETFGYRTVKIPPGVSHGIQNASTEQEVRVINCTHPPYDPNHVDQVDLTVDW